jgi:transcriptional regulator with XRE-family HTH domain
MAKEPELHSPRHEALRKFLKLERQRAELSQGELALKLGWNQRTLSDLENGNKRITALELIHICQCLEIDPCKPIRLVAKIADE